MSPNVLFLLIVSSFFLVNARAGHDDICCYPDNLEGRNWVFQESRYRFFAIDFKAKVLIQTYERYGREFNITDFGNGMKYIFNPDSCRAESHSDPYPYPQCYRSPANQYTLGGAAHGLDVDYFLTFHKDLVAQEIVVRRGAVCYPLISQMNNGVDVETIMFGHEKRNIVHAEILDLITQCQRYLVNN